MQISRLFTNWNNLPRTETIFGWKNYSKLNILDKFEKNPSNSKDFPKTDSYDLKIGRCRICDFVWKKLNQTFFRALRKETQTKLLRLHQKATSELEGWL